MGPTLSVWSKTSSNTESLLFLRLQTLQVQRPAGIYTATAAKQLFLFTLHDFSFKTCRNAQFKMASGIKYSICQAESDSRCCEARLKLRSFHKKFSKISSKCNDTTCPVLVSRVFKKSMFTILSNKWNCNETIYVIYISRVFFFSKVLRAVYQLNTHAISQVVFIIS